MVTLGRRPMLGSHWLLMRCVLGATPQLIQIEVSPYKGNRNLYRHTTFIHIADYDKRMKRKGPDGHATGKIWRPRVTRWCLMGDATEGWLHQC